MTQAIVKTFRSWKNIPLYLQIAIALIVAVGLGTWLRTQPLISDTIALSDHLAIPCNLVLKALRTLATPLNMLAVIHAFLTARIPGRAGRY